MASKVLLSVLLAVSLLSFSCNPEVSVQQYDTLKKDLAALEAQLQALDVQLQALQNELAALNAKNTKTRAYILFLDKLVSTQSSEKLLTGEFDVEALVNASAALKIAAEDLKDNDIVYFLGLINPDNEAETMAAYYKVIEYCLKKLKQYSS